MNEQEGKSVRDVTVDFDHHDPALAADPYARYAELREVCPVTWTDAHDGFWVFSDYDTVFNAARHDEIFKSTPTVGIPWYGTVPNVPLETDAPMTQKYRKLLQADLSPRAVQELAPDIERRVHECIDAFVERGSCDFVTELTLPVTARTILRLIGFDEDRWPECVGWVHKIVHENLADPEGVGQAIMGMAEGVFGLMEARRREPRDDMASKLVRAEIDGEPLDDQTIAGYLTLLLFGGLDTTSGATGNALVRMQRQPEVRERLLADRSLVPEAIEEFLRVDAPTSATARYVGQDTQVCGFTLRAGERALVAWGAANRDPAVFTDPTRFVFDRENTRHLAFGAGLHRCLGSNLARVSFRLMLEAVLDRLPDYVVTADPATCRFHDSSAAYGFRTLPATFTPGPRRY